MSETVGRRQLGHDGDEVARSHAGDKPERDMRRRQFRSRQTGHQRQSRDYSHVHRARDHQAGGFLPNERHQRGPYGLPDGPDCYGHVPVDRDVVANINYVFVSFKLPYYSFVICVSVCLHS